MLIEQYLPTNSDPVYSVHQSCMWFLWRNWRKSTFYPVTAPNDSKCWPIVTWSIQEPTASNCDVTMTECSSVVAMDAFLAQWCWGQWFKEVVKDTSVHSTGGRPRTLLRLISLFIFFILWLPVFQHGASLVYYYYYYNYHHYYYYYYICYYYYYHYHSLSFSSLS